MSNGDGPGNFIFIPHVFNPSDAKKDKTAQKLVSKYAMINRVRPGQRSRSSSQIEPTKPKQSSRHGSREADQGVTPSSTTSAFTTPPRSPSVAFLTCTIRDEDQIQIQGLTSDILCGSSDALKYLNPYSFCNFPSSFDEYDHQLLDTYLGGYLPTPSGFQESHSFVECISNDRLTVFCPAVMKSRTVLSALMAYIHLLVNPSGNGTPNYRARQHLDAALTAVQPDLTDPILALNDATVLSVWLLALAAQRMSDMAAFKAHTDGYASLIRYRAMVKEIAFNDEAFTVDGSRNPGSPGYFSRQTNTNNLLGMLLRNSQVQERPASPGEMGLHTMMSRGMVSESCKNFIDASRVWHRLIALSNSDLRHSTVAAAQHVWADGFASATEPTAFENALQSAIQLAIYLNLPAERDSSGIPVVCMVEAICSWLLSEDSIHVLYSCPDVLLWMVLLTGPFSVGTEAIQLKIMLRRLVDSDDREDCMLESTMDLFLRSFLWNVGLNPGAKAFWHESFDEI